MIASLDLDASSRPRSGSTSPSARRSRCTTRDAPVYDEPIRGRLAILAAHRPGLPHVQAPPRNAAGDFVARSDAELPDAFVRHGNGEITA
jgi:hypothetical protein